MLRRRYHAQAQAAGKAEGGQEAHETGRRGGDSAGSLSRRAADERQIGMEIATFGFAGFLLLLLVITGAVWLLDRQFLRKRRAQDAKQPWWVEYSISFFPVILIVFLLRSFLVEPFKIP